MSWWAFHGNTILSLFCTCVESLVTINDNHRYPQVVFALTLFHLHQGESAFPSNHYIHCASVCRVIGLLHKGCEVLSVRVSDIMETQEQKVICHAIANWLEQYFSVELLLCCFDEFLDHVIVR